MKLIKKQITYVNADGIEKTGYNVAVVINGVTIFVKPVFKDDYRLLVAMAECYENNN